MRNLFLLSALFCMVIVTMLFNSCQKDASSTNENSNKEIIAKVNAWLDSQKSPNQPNKAANIELLKNNLDFSSSRFENLSHDEQLLVIPIKEALKKEKNINKNSILNLVIILNNLENIKEANIIQYLPSSSNMVDKITGNTFKNIYGKGVVSDNGMFRFLSVTGRWLYQLSYENGKLYSSASVQENNNANLHKVSARMNETCIDWYLVTTFYWADGSITQTSEYVGTTCDGCDDPNEMSLCPDGIGGGGNGETTSEYTYVEYKQVHWDYDNTTLNDGSDWTVTSIENIGVIKLSNPPGGGYFIGISHLAEMVGQYPMNFFSWVKTSSSTSYTNSTASVTIAGKITDTRDNTVYDRPDRTHTFNYSEEFP